jgi:hypothetical protein
MKSEFIEILKSKTLEEIAIKERPCIEALQN